MSRRGRRTVAVAAALLAVGGTGACSSGESPSPSVSSVSSVSSVTPSPASTVTPSAPGLEDYTDAGDGCAQAISAIGYADEDLRALGQEPYQEFDDLVRSKLSGVAGTLALEAEDWPDAAVRSQADVVQDLADRTAAVVDEKDRKAVRQRVRNLTRYRVEAARLVLLCRDAGG